MIDHFCLNMNILCVCRKLMGHKPTLQDLKDVHPTIHHNLQKLLTQDGVAQLGLVFQVCQRAHQILLNTMLHLMLYLY